MTFGLLVFLSGALKNNAPSFTNGSSDIKFSLKHKEGLFLYCLPGVYLLLNRFQIRSKVRVEEVCFVTLKNSDAG